MIGMLRVVGGAAGPRQSHQIRRPSRVTGSGEVAGGPAESGGDLLGAGGGCGAAGEAEYGPPVALGVSDRDLGARAVQIVVDMIVSPWVPTV